MARAIEFDAQHSEWIGGYPGPRVQWTGISTCYFRILADCSSCVYDPACTQAPVMAMAMLEGWRAGPSSGISFG